MTPYGTEAIANCSQGTLHGYADCNCPTERRRMNVAEAPGGWLAACDCGWERFGTRRAHLDREATTHVCPKPKTSSQAAPKTRVSLTWDDREGSTWIDKL